MPSVLTIYHVHECEKTIYETWGAGVDIHPSFTFQFRTHFFVRFVPIKLPLPCADQMVFNDM